MKFGPSTRIQIFPRVLENRVVVCREAEIPYVNKVKFLVEAQWDARLHSRKRHLRSRTIGRFIEVVHEPPVFERLHVNANDFTALVFVGWVARSEGGQYVSIAWSKR